jgi:ketosteroid isomerase-like protein
MDNIDYVKTLYAAFASGNIDKLVSEMDPMIEWSTNADPALVPWGGDRHGPAEARAFFDELKANIDYEAFTPIEFLAGRDFVVVRVREVARMKSSGGRLEDEILHLFKLRNGKVTYFRAFTDTHAAVQAFFGGDAHSAGLPSDRPPRPRAH